MAIWLVLPTYDEALNLASLVAAVRGAVDRVVVVDDASPDGTGAIAESLPGVDALHRPARAGIGSAYREGFAHALARDATHVVQMDADFSHDPADVPRLLDAAQAGGLAIGSRYVDGGGVDGWTPVRRALSRAGCRYSRTVLGVPVRDLTGGFKCWTRSALEAVEPSTVRSRGYAFQIEMTYRALRAGVPVVEVPIRFHDRAAGRSKMNWHVTLEAAWRIPLMR